MSWLNVWGLAMGLALAGCSFVPTYVRPQPPVAAQWRDQPVAPAAAPLPGWQRMFNDPQLRELIAQALEHNRGLRIAVQRIDEARALFGVASADLWPTLGVQGTTQRQQLSALDSPTGERVINEQGRFRLGIGITAYELDIWGRVRALHESAGQQLLATEEDARAVQIGLVAEVAAAYYEALAYLSLRERHGQLLDASERSLALIERRRGQGLASELEVRQAQALVLGLAGEQASAERGYVLALNRLELLSGAAVVPSQLQPVALEGEQVLAPVAAGLPSGLLTQRPDIRAAEARLKSHNANIGAARAAYFPRISLTGLLGFSSPELNQLFRGGAKAWSFMPEVTLPVFDFGRRGSQLALAKAQRDIAVSEYERAIQQAFREVADALGATEPLRRELESQRLLVANERRRVELATLLYEDGLNSYLEVLDAQRSLSAAQQGFIRARLAGLGNSLSLYKALGGGWG
ncbi:MULTISPECIES: efflux transporter outer membrane subunit [unclassified Pseudomonas]|uniref:efflux transporter outer membrane subunit n=1 Tax=unclassified Pseudomonas TaxID=196821 RepID=UPI0038040EB5